MIYTNIVSNIIDSPWNYYISPRYAFLRCEDEREQCLYYLQTLNTVDFSCFTNAYSKSSILYQVLIFPSQKSAGASVTSANVWLHVGKYLKKEVKSNNFWL